MAKSFRQLPSSLAPLSRVSSTPVPCSRQSISYWNLCSVVQRRLSSGVKLVSAARSSALSSADVTPFTE